MVIPMDMGIQEVVAIKCQLVEIMDITQVMEVIMQLS
jgi:hypothetical protein